MQILFVGIQSVTLCLFLVAVFLRNGGFVFLYADQSYYIGLYVYPLLLLFSGILFVKFLAKVIVEVYTLYYRSHIFFNGESIFIFGLIIGLILNLVYIAKVSGGI